MSLLSYIELLELVKSGVIDADPKRINAASIDVTLDKTIRLEKTDGIFNIDLSKKENIETFEHEIHPEHGFHLYPGQFILASTIEEFNLPDDIVSEYVCKSSMARNGLNHCLAGYGDPGWHSSKLTLELYNVTMAHRLLLKQGMPIGQVKFHRVTKVPGHASYAATGQYNNQAKVTPSKGIR